MIGIQVVGGEHKPSSNDNFRDPGKPRTPLNAVEVLYNYTDEELRMLWESEEYVLDPSTEYPAIMKNLKARFNSLGMF